MTQLALFEPAKRLRGLATSIERVGDTLNIPEGLQTIPCTHGLHRFPGKFIPNLPRYLLRSALSHRVGHTLCDPFCGSGTTMVEAALEGRAFVGFDIDPLAVAIATAKTQPLPENDLVVLEQHWKDYDYSQDNPGLIPAVPNLFHWFSQKAVAQLSAIKAGCLSLPPHLQPFSLVVFSSIIRRVSNADDQTQKTYVSHTLHKAPPLPSELFPLFLQRAIEGMREYTSLLPKPPNGRVIQADARSLPNIEFDDVLTSPPYIDSLDYVYNQMLEYFWLLRELGVNTYQGFRSLRRAPMGFSPTAPEDLNEVERRLLPSTRLDFKRVCDRVQKRSPKEERVIRAFFHDLAMHCETIYKRQHRGAIYICIVGNSTVRQVAVPTAALIGELFESVGYTLIDRFTYEIRRHYMKFPRRRNSGTIKNDHILVFRR